MQWPQFTPRTAYRQLSVRVTTFYKAGIPLHEGVPFCRTQFPTRYATPRRTCSRAVNPTHSYLPAYSAGNVYIPAYTSADASSPSVIRSPVITLLPSVIHSTARRKSSSPRCGTLTTTASTESTTFYTQYGRDDELPTSTTTPDVVTTATVGTAPSVIPRPSSSPQVRTGRYFAEHFALPVPFQPTSVG